MKIFMQGYVIRLWIKKYLLKEKIINIKSSQLLVTFKTSFSHFNNFIRKKAQVGLFNKKLKKKY